LADILTKPLPLYELEKLRGIIMGVPMALGTTVMQWSVMNGKISSESGISISRGAVPGTAPYEGHSATHKTVRFYDDSHNAVQRQIAEVQEKSEAREK